MTRVDGELTINSASQDRVYSAANVIAVLDGNLGTGGGGGDGGTTILRTSQQATYTTPTANPQAVYYTALDIDGVTVITPRTLTGVNQILLGTNYSMYGYDQPIEDGRLDWIAVWDEGDPNTFTSSWETVGGPAGITTPGGGGSGLADAHFTMTQSQSSLITLDASTSTGDGYTWEIDHVARPEITASVTYGPLAVGVHHVKLTVTDSSDGSFDISQRDVNVAWIAEPVDQAQRDPINSVPGFGGENLSPWTEHIAPIGPWRRIVVLNEEDPDGDGDPRIIVPGDGTVTLMARAGDRPGSSGGYRAALEWNTAYDGISPGYPLGIVDNRVTGNIEPGDTTGELRFYRFEYKIHSTNADGSNPPGYPSSLLYMNNFGELHGNFGGDATWCPCTSTNGAQIGVNFESLPGGIATNTRNEFDMHNISTNWDVWQNYVVECLLSLDGSQGYIRVYRDGSIVTSVPSGTDGQGRFFAVTQQTDSGGANILMAFSAEVYRTKAQIDLIGTYPTVPDVTVSYRNIRVGPTMASVMAL